MVAGLSSFRGREFTTGEITFANGARMDIDRRYRVLAVIDGELSVLTVEEVGDEA